MSLADFKPLPDSGLGLPSYMTTATVPNDVKLAERKSTDANTKTSSASDNSVFTNDLVQAGQNLTQDLLNGEFDIGKTLGNINQMIQKSLMGVVKSKILEMLLGGNDQSDAAKDHVKTAGDVAQGAKTLTTLQTKLLDGGINALQQLVTTGQIDLQSYANDLMNTMIQVGAEGCEAQILGENNEKLNQTIQEKQNKNKELQTKMQDIMKKYNLQKTEDKDGNVSYQDKNGNPVDLTSNPELAGIIKELNENISTISTNVGLINTNTEIINKNTENADKLTNVVTQGIQDLAVKGENIGQVVRNTAGTLIKEGLNEIKGELMSNIGILQGDAVTAGVNSGVDTAAATAAPTFAAAEEVGSFGTASGHVATILANGVADGAAAVVRGLTGSNALGGIVTNLAAGQGLAQVLNTALNQVVNEAIDSGINALVAEITNPIDEENNNITTQNSETIARNQEIMDQIPQMA